MLFHDTNQQTVLGQTERGAGPPARACLHPVPARSSPDLQFYKAALLPVSPPRGGLPSCKHPKYVDSGSIKVTALRAAAFTQ